MAELVFFTGTMDSGKSTLALQTHHNHTSRGRRGLVFSRHDRAGEARLSSRLGLSMDALEVRDDTDFWTVVAGRHVEYLVCDEAQFYAPEQVEQLARLVDEAGVDVYAFGILADFRTRLFPGSARLVELADRVETLQVQALCWCGARATHNARTVGGRMVVEGDQVVVGDTGASEDGPGAGAGGGVAQTVAYEVLCRRHHARRMTLRAASVHTSGAEMLPLDLPVPSLPSTALPSA
ncbi:thymidine kinase [Luteimicrobium subarcticum]|uniref:Thymidine kinase n=1 Tax=Luteimicrobium subarcticum TaxID=620910 RepID=A0A2M8W460_9MICO|nr:thymidine kinase [Luteimicrobium subarcticum]PJI85711.1 thymidine kinase [Luteimicrobium subarcticum]